MANRDVHDVKEHLDGSPRFNVCVAQGVKTSASATVSRAVQKRGWTLKGDGVKRELVFRSIAEFSDSGGARAAPATPPR